MAILISDEILLTIVDGFDGKRFTAKDVAVKIESLHPILWKQIVAEYGVGGKGAGVQYSAFSRVAQALQRLYVQGSLHKWDYEDAPTDYGSPVIRYWSTEEDSHEFHYEDEEDPSEKFSEGAMTTVLVNKYERNSRARKACIAYHGISCVVCHEDLSVKYGHRGIGLIQVHHLIPLSKIKKEYEVDPIKDLRPVCPNCHSIIHRGPEMLSIEDMVELVSNKDPTI